MSHCNNSNIIFCCFFSSLTKMMNGVAKLYYYHHHKGRPNTTSSCLATVLFFPFVCVESKFMLLVTWLTKRNLNQANWLEDFIKANNFLLLAPFHSTNACHWTYFVGWIECPFMMTSPLMIMYVPNGQKQTNFISWKIPVECCIIANNCFVVKGIFFKWKSIHLNIWRYWRMIEKKLEG